MVDKEKNKEINFGLFGFNGPLHKDELVTIECAFKTKFTYSLLVKLW